MMMQGSGMMGSGMMTGQGGGMGMMGQMISQDPELQEKINQQRQEHEQIMQELMASDLNDPQIQQKILEQMQKHQEFMRDLMSSANMQDMQQ